MADLEERQRQKREQALGISHGCLFAAASTVITCLLLFVNGGLVSALCRAFADSGPHLFQDVRVQQFVIFVAPVFLVIVQWLMIDYVIQRLRRWP